MNEIKFIQSQDPTCMTAEIGEEWALLAFTNGWWEVWDLLSVNRCDGGKTNNQQEAMDATTNWYRRFEEINANGT
jgi:hypothetical protein